VPGYQMLVMQLEAHHAPKRANQCSGGKLNCLSQVYQWKCYIWFTNELQQSSFNSGPFIKTKVTTEKTKLWKNFTIWWSCKLTRCHLLQTSQNLCFMYTYEQYSFFESKVLVFWCGKKLV